MSVAKRTPRGKLSNLHAGAISEVVDLFLGVCADESLDGGPDDTAQKVRKGERITEGFGWRQGGIQLAGCTVDDILAGLKLDGAGKGQGESASGEDD